MKQLIMIKKKIESTQKKIVNNTGYGNVILVNFCLNILWKIVNFIFFIIFSYTQ